MHQSANGNSDFSVSSKSDICICFNALVVRLLQAKHREAGGVEV